MSLYRLTVQIRHHQLPDIAPTPASRVAKARAHVSLPAVRLRFVGATQAAVVGTDPPLHAAEEEVHVAVSSLLLPRRLAVDQHRRHDGQGVAEVAGLAAARHVARAGVRLAGAPR